MNVPDVPINVQVDPNEDTEWYYQQFVSITISVNHAVGMIFSASMGFCQKNLRPLLL
jgi:hypothetical protein